MFCFFSLQANALWSRVNVSSVAGGRERLLESLTAKVREVYTRLRLSDTHSDPIEMLREIERHLERLLGAIATLAVTNRDRVLELERQREGARRARVREARRREVDRQTKERLAIAMARAKAEVVKVRLTAIQLLHTRTRLEDFLIMCS
mgnify:CR=1 FL=1